MAVGFLPYELPREASRYCVEQLLKHIFADLVGNGSQIIDKATMVKSGRLTNEFAYLKDYAGI